MSEQPTFVSDDGDLRKYRTETPNLVYDIGLDPHSGWLYGHLKRIAGDSGVCWRGTRALAEIANMSVGAVSKAKAELKRRGLIVVKEGNQRKGEADEIRIANIWRRNFGHFDADTPVHNMNTPPVQDMNAGGERVQNTNTPFTTRTPRSQYEHKKEPLEEVTIENPSDEGSKKPAPSSPTPKVRKVSVEEATERFETLCEADPQGEGLRQLAELLAEENKAGEVAITRVWREIGARFAETRKRHDLTEEAWAYGFDRALAKGAPNIGYVLKAAKGYRPGDGEGRPSRSIAVIGARDEDYNVEEYRFND